MRARGSVLVCLLLTLTPECVSGMDFGPFKFFSSSKADHDAAPCKGEVCCEAVWRVANRRDVHALLLVSRGETTYEEAIKGMTTMELKQTKDLDLKQLTSRTVLPSRAALEFRAAADCKGNADLVWSIFTKNTPLKEAHSVTYDLQNKDSVATLIDAVVTVAKGSSSNRVFKITERATRPYHAFVVQRWAAEKDGSLWFRVYSAFAQSFRLVDWMTAFATQQGPDGLQRQKSHAINGAQLLNQHDFTVWFTKLWAMYATYVEHHAEPAKARAQEIAGHEGHYVGDFYRLVWTADGLFDVNDPAHIKFLDKKEVAKSMPEVIVTSADYTPASCTAGRKLLLPNKNVKKVYAEWGAPALPVFMDAANQPLKV